MNKFARLLTLSVAALAFAALGMSASGFAQSQPQNPPAATTTAPMTSAMHAQQATPKAVHQKRTGHMARKSGASNQDIKSVQTALNKAGYDLKADGVLGPKTRAAIKKYQSSNGLHATGAVDSVTLKKLGVS